jgi:Domain of unknown function (DUF4136)
MLLAPIFIADSRYVEADEKTDFTAFKTFAIREGRATSRKAEINNKLILKNIEEAIRSSLLSKGLTEAQDRPDLTVVFNLAEEGQRGVVGRGIRHAHVVSQSEGTLVIEMSSRDASRLVWQGIYTDDEGNASKLAKNLPDDAKKLISQYPPKRK